MRAWAQTVRIKIFLAAGLANVLACPLVSAAESAPDWRAVWDQSLMWINFGILVFVIIKFGRTPIKTFFQGKRKEIGQKIGKLEEEKETVRRQIDEIMKAVEDSQAQFEDLKNRIIEQGEKNKQEIIEDAREMGRVMLDGARRRIDHQILEAGETLRAELIDAAVDLAMERLPKTITAEDQNNLIEHYLAGAKGNA